MTLGKALRLRRIFAQGRALVVDCRAPREEPVGWVRLLARSGPDAVILTPGLLDVVAEELGRLAVILRLDPGSGRLQPLLSVQAALEMGAEAVASDVAAAVGESLERFGRISEEARRLGMPVLAEVRGEDWIGSARLSADYGADLISACVDGEAEALRSCIRVTGKPLLVRLEPAAPLAPQLLEQVWQVMQGPAQGIVLSLPCPLSAEAGHLLQAIHGLVHQDISLEEARAVGGLAPPTA